MGDADVRVSSDPSQRPSVTPALTQASQKRVSGGINFECPNLRELQRFFMLKFPTVVVDVFVLRFRWPDPSIAWFSRKFPTLLQNLAHPGAERKDTTSRLRFSFRNEQHTVPAGIPIDVLPPEAVAFFWAPEVSDSTRLDAMSLWRIACVVSMPDQRLRVEGCYSLWRLKTCLPTVPRPCVSKPRSRYHRPLHRAQEIRLSLGGSGSLAEPFPDTGRPMNSSDRKPNVQRALYLGPSQVMSDI